MVTTDKYCAVFCDVLDMVGRGGGDVLCMLCWTGEKEVMYCEFCRVL